MQIAVCDDNKNSLIELKEQLRSLGIVENIFVFDNLQGFLFSVESGNVFDAVFMDIEWGHENTGIDAAGELYKLNPDIKVIYVTGYGDRYSQNIFLHNANLSGFLTKPVDKALLIANLEKVADAIQSSTYPSVFIRQGGGMVSVPCIEIYYIESKARNIELYTINSVIKSYGKLDSIIEDLPVWFIQCHKSYVVNMRQIQRFLSNQILLKNGDCIPVSRSKYSKAKEAYFNFVGEMF